MFSGSTEKRNKLAVKNYSAVVYLDKARFRYFRDSSVTCGLAKKYVDKLVCTDVDIEPGTSPLIGRCWQFLTPCWLVLAVGMAVLFPSTTIHQARPSRDDPGSRRRTVVLFDLENPDEDEHRIENSLRHKVPPFIS